jgi:hypothetical protein
MYPGNKRIINDEKILLFYESKSIYVTKNVNTFNFNDELDVNFGSLMFLNGKNEDFGLYKYISIISLTDNYYFIQRIMEYLKIDFTIFSFMPAIKSSFLRASDDGSYVWLNPQSEKYELLNRRYNTEIKENNEMTFFYGIYSGDKCITDDENKVILLYKKKKFYVTRKRQLYLIKNENDITICSFRFEKEENDLGHFQYILIPLLTENYGLIQKLMEDFKMDYSLVHPEYGEIISSIYIHKAIYDSYIWLNPTSEKYSILNAKYNPSNSKNTMVKYFFDNYKNVFREFENDVNFKIEFLYILYPVKFVDEVFEIYDTDNVTIFLSFKLGEKELNKYATILSLHQKADLMQKIMIDLKLDYCMIGNNELLESEITYELDSGYIWLNLESKNYSELSEKYQKIAKKPMFTGMEANKIELDYRKARNIDNVETMIKTNTLRHTILKFKKNFDKSVKDFPVLLENRKIKSIEETITDSEKRTQDMLLFSEPYDLESPIKKIDKAYLADKFTDIVVFKKNSKSRSFVFKAKYMSKPCYIKCFYNDFLNKRLQFEQKIYGYIKNRNERIKKYYQDYFVKVYDLFVVPTNFFINFLDDSRATIEGTSTSWQEYHDGNVGGNLYRNLETRSFTDLYFIVTEDIGGITYKKYQKEIFYNEKISTETLFDVCYGFYLLNYRLLILHGDNHFANISIKINLPEHDAKYIIEDVEYTRKKNYRICIYDFDRSVFNLKEHDVNLLSYCQDVWTIALFTPFYALRSYEHPTRTSDVILTNKLMYSKYQPSKADIETFNTELKYLEHIVFKIMLNHNQSLVTDYITKYRMIYNKIPINNFERAPAPRDANLNWIKILERFIFDPRTKLSLDILRVNPFYKKYLKYKEKYIKLKNK